MSGVEDKCEAPAEIVAQLGVVGVVRASMESPGFPGISAVRVLLDEDSDGHLFHKFFWLLATRDLDRDRRIVELMLQLQDVSPCDFDLVPGSRAHMIPPRAVAVA